MSDAAQTVTVTAGRFRCPAFDVPVDQVLQVEPYEQSSLLRSGIIFALCCLGPIASMVAFTIFAGDPLLRWGLGLLFAAGPAIGIGIALYWPKQWTVVVELPEAYRTVLRCGDQATAEATTARLRQDLAA